MSSGADAPLGPGWWRASDGRYYPPELAPGASSQPGSAGAPGPPSTPASSSAQAASPEGSPADGESPPKKASPPKKKVIKKVAAKRADGSAAAARKRVVKKVVRPSAANATPPAGAPTDNGADHEPESPEVDAEDDETPRRPGQMKYTARAPASDQIAARRIQAKEQLVLLSDARQEAALRTLASLGISQPELVGVGARSLDARAAPETGQPVPVEPVTKAVPTPLEGPAPSTAPTGPQAPEARAQPTPPGPVAAPPPAVPSPAPSAPARSAPAPSARAPSAPRAVTPPPVAPPPISPGPAATPPGPSEAGRAAELPSHEVGEPAAASEAADAALEGTDTTEAATISPHEPLRGPAPTAAPMGTDVPFMEVKGSALGADLDRIGERILIFANRVELRDRSNTVRQTIRYDQLRSVEVHKKLMGPTLTVTSTLGAAISVKALRSPELASGAKAMIDKHAARFREGGAPVTPDTDLPTASTTSGAVTPTARPTATAPTPTAPTPTEISAPPTVPSTARAGGTETGTHRSVLIAMLEELHESGILSEEELDAKRSLIEGGPTI